LENTCIRLVIATSLDGKIALSENNKVHLGGRGDRQVLEESLAWSDATIMGANTLKVHESTCLISNPKLIDKRQAKGKGNQPISIIISRKNAFCFDWEFFNQPIDRWLLTTKKEREKNIPKTGFVKHLTIQSNWAKTISKLRKKGIFNIVILGGAELASSLLKEDQIDELQLTFTPRVIGGLKSWFQAKNNNFPIDLTRRESWSLKELKDLGEDEFLVRYHRER